MRPILKQNVKLIYTATNQLRTKYTLPDLPYAYNALEPVISEEIMRTHHQKHHQAYINNLNNAIEQFTIATHSNDAGAQASLTAQINFNAGGYINHCIFWKNLCPPSQAKGKPNGKLLKAIEDEFGSFEGFKKFFGIHTGAIQGSGWGWLGFNTVSGRVQFATTGNQDALLAHRGLIPLLGIDVWEHAYYLQYKNMRPDYVKAMWDIVNWDDVASRFENAIQISEAKK